MDDFKVHYNSDKPTQLQAHAYAKGSDLHIAPGQEKHLPLCACAREQYKKIIIAGSLLAVVGAGGVFRYLYGPQGLFGESDSYLIRKKMRTYTDKIAKNNKQSAANRLVQKRHGGSSAFRFVDNRYAPVTQKKRQEQFSSEPQYQQAGGEVADNLFQKREPVKLQNVIQGNWKHMAGGALLGFAGAMIGGAALPVIAGATALGGIAGGIAGYFSGKKEEPYRFGDSVRDQYMNWSEDQKSNIPIISRGGVELRARHNRGAPYVTRSKVGDAYSSFIPAAVGSEDDRLVAKDLLHNTSHAVKSDAQKENAAMMEAVVGLAEEWRKHGAAWIYRAILRGVEAGKWTMSQIPTLFAFVRSANSGRRQVARIQDVKAGRLPVSALVGDEKDIMGYGSDIDDEGFESDEEVRSRHGMKGRRLFSTKYDSKYE